MKKNKDTTSEIKIETLQEFINDTVLKDTQIEERTYYFGELCRMCNDAPFWALFIHRKENKGNVSTGGHYPLNITNMDDFTKVLDIFCVNKMELKVDTQNFFALN